MFLGPTKRACRYSFTPMRALNFGLGIENFVSAGRSFTAIDVHADDLIAPHPRALCMNVEILGRVSDKVALRQVRVHRGTASGRIPCNAPWTDQFRVCVAGVVAKISVPLKPNATRLTRSPRKALRHDPKKGFRPDESEVASRDVPSDAQAIASV